MNNKFEFALRVLVIGIGATLLMDLWTIFLKVFGIQSLNYAFLGRWLGHLPRGQWIHGNIAQSTPVRHELLLGWVAHYTIGISFAALLVAVYGLDWARSPSLLPALVIGLVTLAAPYFILQPGLGAGIASAKTPAPNFNRIKSLMTHTVYGFGLYFAAWAAAYLIPVVDSAQGGVK